jgi:2-oxo-4-hydroxy-4-carboxy-5-ureidoimidazoline decarboxylase
MGKDFIMTLHEFNILPADELKEALIRCCASSAWVHNMMSHIPVEDLVELLEDAEIEWWKLSEDDWKEAFLAHPKIGDPESLSKKFAATGKWASDEQKNINEASAETIHALIAANKMYEQKFGYIFIVCATGKSAAEMLGILHTRLQNDPPEEIKIAADEQNQITKLRIQKLLA